MKLYKIRASNGLESSYSKVLQQSLANCTHGTISLQNSDTQKRDEEPIPPYYNPQHTRTTLDQ